MADAYLTIATIAEDTYMLNRVRACATQQAHLGSVPAIEDPGAWSSINRFVWAASPGWAEKWDYAVQTHPDDADPETPPYQPGRDASVITDDDVLATVQALGA